MRRPATYLKIGLSLVALALVLNAAQPLEIVRVLQRAQVGYLLAAVALWFVIQLLNVYKWSLLNRAQGLVIPFRRLLDVYYMGMFFNTFLPSGFGGDALRAYELSRMSKQGGSSVASVAIDRFTSLYALLLVATVSRYFAPPDWQVMPLSWLISLDAVAAIAFWAACREAWLRQIAAWPLFEKRPGVVRFLGDMASSLGALSGAPVAVLVTLGISVLYQFLNVVLHFLLLLALGLSVTFAYTACFLPLLVLVASLPLSINGLGIREGGFVYFLGKAGVPAADAVSVGIMSLGMLLLSGLVGAIIYSGSSKRKDPRPSPLT